MADKKLEGKVEVTAADEDYLHQMSLTLQSFGQALKSLYDETDNLKEIEALDEIKTNIQKVQTAVGTIRTDKFKGITADLKEAQSKLKEQIDRLEKIVGAVNRINELIDISTQIAQIAAGMMV